MNTGSPSSKSYKAGPLKQYVTWISQRNETPCCLNKLRLLPSLQVNEVNPNNLDAGNVGVHCAHPGLPRWRNGQLGCAQLHPHCAKCSSRKEILHILEENILRLGQRILEEWTFFSFC